MALLCPRCRRKGAYLTYGTNKRRDGKLWRYRQKHCSGCGYVGTRHYTVPVR